MLEKQIILRTNTMPKVDNKYIISGDGVGVAGAKVGQGMGWGWVVRN